ncbi:MAG: sigma-70 family RNA polymerase sigma factor [Cytophagales bacterium]|nr:sigma-70 family RNA polymerase sigma factor [Bernardetiaceae bacterium]MDW8204151.1 sigma-70 family RNA polymerase sigma factor [Cytophagales bacterium]
MSALEPITADIHRYLIERCLENDRKAQFQIYKLYADAMYNVCCRMLKNEADAQDVLQEAFVDAFTKLHTFRFDAPFGSWLKRIVINRCVNALKKRKLLTIHVEEKKLAHLPDDEPADMHEDEIEWEISKVRRCMDKLPEGARIVCNLYLFEGYDHAEIAEILNITEATSKAQYSKARKRLREMLMQEKTTLWKIN